MNQNQITKIEIDGYKSIQHASIDLDMCNVLIGSNGAGKSNFISLFKLLQSMIDGNMQYYVAQNGGPERFLYFGSKNTESMGVKFYFGENGYQFILEPTVDNAFVFREESFYWETIGSRRIATGNLESRWKNGTNTGIDYFVQPVLEKQKWRVYHFHDTGKTADVKKLGGINESYELAVDAGNLAAFLYRLKQTDNGNYIRIVNVVRMVSPYFREFFLEPDPVNPNLIALQWFDHEMDMPFLADQLSDGTLRFICLATLLLQPETLMPETIIIDEPELGLHPYAINVLAGLIKKASVNKQIIISTQSSDLVNEFNSEDIIVVNHKDTGSEFLRLNSEELRVWFDEDYHIGDLWKQNVIGGRP